MDQGKIGRFIKERRVLVGLTQMQLAEMLGITDRAVSKWETGKALPDASLMLSLCDILKITVNDLLCGEVVRMENYDKKLEKNLLEMIKEKEDADRRLLKTEIAMGVCSALPLIAGVIISLTTHFDEWIRVTVIFGSMIPILVALPFLLRIEQKAGYYECDICKHRHVPSYASVFFAPHVNRTRYLRCPRCEKASWQKKVISREAKNDEIR